jgi:hypothetical protein
MCVILVVDERRPSEHMIAKAWAQNDHGAGIAYRVTGEDGLPYVEWKKGLSLDEIQALVQTVPVPFITHFRIASIGGIRQELTHPFEISTSAESKLEGRTRNYVLFHNGHWDQWSGYMLQAAGKFGLTIPFGKYSDSRAMAWLGAVYSQGFYELLEKQKIVAFGPDDVNFFGDGWKLIDGVSCSNDHFINRYVPGFSKPQAEWNGLGNEECEHPNCTKRAGVIAGNRHVCFDHVNWLSTRTVQPCSYANCRENAVWGERFCMDHSGFKSAKESSEVFEGKMVHLLPHEKGDTSQAQERSPFEKLLHAAVEKNPQMVLKVAQREFEKGKKVSRLSKNGLKRITSEVEQRLWAEKQVREKGQLAFTQPQGLPS